MQSYIHPISQAVDSAIRFLQNARTSTGWWLDFCTSEGISDEWVTAYVGVCLAGVRSAAAAGLKDMAWKRVWRRRWWLSGWAYNFRVPLDADSTIWAIRLAETVNQSHRSRIRRAYKFLEKHINDDGGIATYSRKSPIWLHIGLVSRDQCRGWLSSHACVAAAAACLAKYQKTGRFSDYLSDTREEDGSWEGYWWADPEYTTSLALEGLQHSPRSRSLKELIDCGRSWLADRLKGGKVATEHLPQGSPFATGCALRGLAIAASDSTHRQVLEEAASWLTAVQHEDGSWESSARLRIPPPNYTDPRAVDSWHYRLDVDSGSIKLDQNRIFTTATVVAGLSAFQNLISSK